MSENTGETSREDYGAYSVDDENQLQPEDTLVDRGLDDALGEGYSAPEKWSAAERYGNTPYEEEVGESLDQRLSQEEPEPDPYAEEEYTDEEYPEGPRGEVGTRRSGRLVAGDEGSHEDTEKDLVAEDVGINGAGASAEEAAVHIVEEE